jgi:hypothetical protein
MELASSPVLPLIPAMAGISGVARPRPLCNQP